MGLCSHSFDQILDPLIHTSNILRINYYAPTAQGNAQLPLDDTAVVVNDSLKEKYKLDRITTNKRTIPT